MSDKKAVRERFRTSVFERDGYKCRCCGATGDLDAHHITDRHDMPNGGYVPENGISLCPECHLKAERYHASGHKEFVEGYHPDQLYALIGSSYELAFETADAA